MKACIATGARPKLPNIKNLDEIHMDYYTSDNIFNLTQQPKHLIIFGGGPVGAELGQAFARLGTRVTFLIRGDRFLPREDRDAANFLQKQME